MITTAQKEIARLVGVIVEKHKPEKIYLFGSFAWGKPHKDSDLDFLVVKKSIKPSRKIAQEIDLSLIKRQLPVDVIVYSPDYLKRRLSLGDYFAQKIVDEGKLIYEKNQ